MTLLIGGNGHQSAFARRIAGLEVQVEYYKAMVAALIVREGGDITIPREAMGIKGDLKITHGKLTIRIEMVRAVDEIAAAAAAAEDAPSAEELSDKPDDPQPS